MKTEAIEELFDQLERSGMTVHRSRAELAALRAEVERLREALEKYGRHLCDCGLWQREQKCTCGYYTAAMRDGQQKGKA